MQNVYAIIPAAGRSRRMGTQKLLLPFAGTTVIEHVVRQVRAAPVRGVIVVVSDGAGAVATAARRTGADVVVNPEPDSEMLDSVRCGVRALPADCDAALVATGDQPTVRPEVIREMIAARGEIVVPACNGRRGHPILFTGRFFGEVLTHYDDVGLKGLLAAHPGNVREITVADDAVLEDMDDPEAYRKALARNQARTLSIQPRRGYSRPPLPGHRE
jgi:molybdenum cofactor cytidylyltransferase